MARLAISADFQRDYANLEKSVRNRVDELSAKFRDHTHAGLHLEKYQGQRDPRARTVRINDFFRGIVLAPDDGDLFVLTRVLTHDDADRWMTQNEFRVNEATGALEVYNVVHVERAVVNAESAPASAVDLFAHRKDKEFAQVGVMLPVTLLRRVANEAELEQLLEHIPQMQADAVIELRGSDSVDEIFARLVADAPSDPVDTTDIAAALDRPVTQAAFHVVATDDDLRDVLTQPFAIWRTYLHPTQRQLAYRVEYKGPVRVTGGPGTGKTVVAMHRVKALADALDDRTGKPILMTTFTKNLARSIENDLKSLGGPELLAVTQVRNLDSLAMEIVRDHESARPRVASNQEQDQLWQQVVDELGVAHSPEFLAAEWEQIVLAQSVTSRDEYLKVARPGRGIRLDRRQRLDVWRAIEAFTAELATSGRRTFLQLAADAAGYVRARSVKPFRHVVVDEAQDLHETQWRLIRALVEEQPNDLFIVGDSHQRIYDNRASLGKVGIKIVGRAYRLRTCYRTTRQILHWSLALLGEGDYDDLDEGTDTLSGYRSWLTGPAPVMAGSSSKAHELDKLVEIVKGWIDGGVSPDDIGIAARSSQLLEPVKAAFASASLSTYEITGDEDKGSPTAVRVATMHRMKGLEFRCVAVVDADDRTVPLQSVLIEKSIDTAQHDAEVRRERCRLYVACTRARDSLAVLWSGKPSRFLESMLP